MLCAEHLSVRYGEKEAVRDLSFRVGKGEWWAVIGPNGAGKSSLASALGKTVPFDGIVTLQGQNIRSYAPQAFARKVGVLSQTHGAVYGFTVEEVVGLGRYAYTGFFRRPDPDGPERMDRALAVTGLASLRKRNMLTLSGGEQQRVFLAQVLCQDPDLLILDEPANHLDLPFRQELFSLIGDWLNKPDKAVITVMHDLSLARKYASHALLMDRGRCAAQGPMDEVLAPETLKAVYGMDVYAWMRNMYEQWI